MFLNCSTCFGRNTAHHHELKNCNCSLWFYIRLWLLAPAMGAPNSNSCIFTLNENWTHVHINLFTRNSPYYHILKYLLFLLKHPVYNLMSHVSTFKRVLTPWMWVPVTTAWRVLRLRMEELPPVWRVDVNKLNKQPRTADEGWSSSLGVGRGANNPSP